MRAAARPAARLLAAALPALLALAACGEKIGDGCQSNVDCSSNGERTCDASSPGGYCTIEGCEADSCPGEAVCVRFFSAAFLTRPCDPSSEDVAGGTDACDDRDELCLSSGLCARRDTERRFCQLECGGDGDCRDGYACRFSGSGGAEVVTSAPGDEPQRFCGVEP